MKILVVSSGFTGATLPLANCWSRNGNDVVCYYIVQCHTSAIESLDFERTIGVPTGKPIPVSKTNLIYNYLDKNVELFLLPKWKQKKRLEKLFIGKIFPWLNNRLVNKYIEAILSERPDYVNLVVHNDLDLKVANALYDNRIPFCISYHEVLDGLDSDNKLKSVVKESLNLGMPIVVHSQKTSVDLIRASKEKNLASRIHIINFGAFESYLSYGEGCLLEGVPEKYLLYLGHIHPYKGLKYLYDAVKLLDDKLDDVKILVAGGGYDPTIELMKRHSRFIVINHFIANAELVGLIRNCMAIICPYIAASQSGLVQTGMVFKKPVIATKVGAFTEIIQDGVNGYLCDPADSGSLANAIVRFTKNKNSLQLTSIPENLRWEKIADKYIRLFEASNNKT